MNERNPVTKPTEKNEIIIKPQYKEGTKLFAVKEGEDGLYLVPVKIESVANVEFLGKDLQIITYSCRTNQRLIHVKEANLYPLEKLSTISFKM